MITEETYNWVEELLDPKITEISDSDYDRLVKDYFQKDKRDWLEKNRILEYVSNIVSFWRLIRKFSIPKGKKLKIYNFKNFVFPSFYEMEINENNNFWTNYEDKIFQHSVDFREATFLDYSVFEKVIFEKDVKFQYIEFENNLIIKDCTFKGNVLFQKSKINNLNLISSTFSNNFNFTDNECNGDVNIFNTSFQGFLPSFYDSKFHKKVIFSKTTFSSAACRFNESIFLDDVEFFECKFKPKQKIEFQAVNFTKKVDFIRCEFLNDTNFNQSQFQGVTIFDRPIFKEETDFSYCYFEDVNFKEINTIWPYRNYNYTEPPKLYFKDVFFNSKTFIKNTNLSELELDNSDVTNITFSRCIWNDEKNRLKLVNELPILNIETKNKLKLSNQNEAKKIVVENLINKLRDSENHYRQLKKNFDSTKNWELSGKAYVSEMEMRRLRYKKEKSVSSKISFIIYSIYEHLGGYTQSFVRPLNILLLFTLFIFPLYYFTESLIYYSLWNCSFTESFSLVSVSECFQMSIDAALPIFKPKHTYLFWGVQYFQTIFCGTLLTFFILALRKRFKQ
ncbi:pentapeptide repeat-containing protein [Kordia sp.]|uniref:pentapeptide repeat-containing protein n=1 Tax=Kordia sp. TaxID=1965332 RepID=UPI003B599FBD